MLARAFRQKGCFVKGAGAIVFLSSVAGLTGEPGIAAYAASKAAVIGITKALAMELLREGIRVNAIAAGMVRSEMTERILQALSPEQISSIEAQHPMGFGTAGDVANGVAYLVSDAARWVTGTTLVIDGGYTAR